MFKKTLLLTTLIACLQPALANEEDPWPARCSCAAR